MADAEGWAQGWAANVALNLVAPAELCRLAIQHYRSRSGGVLINVTSRSAHRGDDPDHLAYGAAKGGLLALTKGIAGGFGAEGVLAYAVAPGWVATDIAAEAESDVGGWAVSSYPGLRRRPERGRTARCRAELSRSGRGRR